MSILAVFIITVATSETKDTNTAYVHLTGRFDYENIDALAEKLHAIDDGLDKDDVLVINITSPGGVVLSFNNLRQYVNKAPFTITTKVTSHAYSAGAYLFALGDNRIMREDARIMFHPPLFNIAGMRFNALDIEEALKAKEESPLFKLFGEDSLREFLDVLIKGEADLRKLLETRFSKDVVDKILIRGKDVFLTAKEAYELGLATSVEPLTYERKRI